jgi:hypothetical protein
MVLLFRDKKKDQCVQRDSAGLTNKAGAKRRVERV